MKVYNNYSAEKFLSKNFPVSQSQLVKSLKQIKIHPPLVLKIISNDALHKTEINGVRIVKHHKDLDDAFHELIGIAKLRRIKLEGILVQKYYEGEQFIIGIKKDPVFNHVILFGLGGVFTELLDDVAIRKCPISLDDAQEMLDELRAKKIFYGFRNKNLNRQAIKRLLVKMSKLPLKNKKITELDINPVILNSHEARIVDARIIMA